MIDTVSSRQQMLPVRHPRALIRAEGEASRGKHDINGESCSLKGTSGDMDMLVCAPPLSRDKQSSRAHQVAPRSVGCVQIRIDKLDQCQCVPCTQMRSHADRMSHIAHQSLSSTKREKKGREMEYSREQA